MGLIGEVYADAGLHIDNASFAQYGAMLQQAEGQISNFSSASMTMLAGAFTVPAAVLTGVAAYGVSVASSMQDASMSLTTVYGDLDVAKEKFTWLSDFAASTPFEFPELLDATVKLKAYGIEAQDYLGILGDTASAMGKTLSESADMLADAQTGEFERLKEFGVKAVEITTKNYEKLGVAAEQAGQTALMYTDKYGQEQVKVIDRNNREAITAALVGVDGIFQKYTGAMEARSKTLSGMLSTIKDNISMGLADIVGFKDMEVQTTSLMGVLMGLAGVAVTVTGSFNDMSEPMQTFISVSALGVAAIGLLAAGFIGYSLILPLITSETAIFGVTLSAAIWPVTAIVGGLALLAAGLVYLEEKTGLVSFAWQVAKDAFTIFYDWLSTGIGDLSSWIGAKIDEIQAYFMDIIPQGALDAVSGFYNWATDKFGGAADTIHEKAEGIRQDNIQAGASFDEYSNVDMSGTGSAITTIDQLINSTGTDTKTGTGLLQEMGSVPATGTIAGLTGVKSGAQDANTTTKALDLTLTDAGTVSFNGTTSQISLVNSTGKTTALTISQVFEYLQKSGNVSQAGTKGQLALVDSQGRTTNLTTQQAISLLSKAGSQSMSGTISGINGITSAWTAAQRAAQQYAAAAISQRAAEKLVEGSTSTGQTKNGITVVAAGQPIKSGNTINVGTINNNGENVSAAKTMMSIVGNNVGV